LVPAGTSGTYGAVPSSGTISIQNFYGTSNYIPVYVEELFATSLYNPDGGTVYTYVRSGVPLASTAEWASYGLKQNTTSAAFAYDVAADSSGNVYMCGYTFSGARQLNFVCKFTPAGTLSWLKTFYDAGFNGNLDLKKIELDSSNNVYVAGYMTDAIQNYGYIAKYNSSGAVQWERQILNSAPSFASSLALDSSNNLYVSGHANNGGVSRGLLFKYDTNGNIQWQRELRKTSLEVYIDDIATDGSGNVYISGKNQVTGYSPFIAKYDSSGTLQWQREITSFASSGNYYVTADSSGNAYIAGNTPDPYGVIIKYDTSGTIQWQRELTQGSNAQMRRPSVDSSGNVYVPYRFFQGTSYTGILKLNSSGTVQWQRALGFEYSWLFSSKTKANGKVYCAGYTNDGVLNFPFASALAQDGSTTSGTAIVGMMESALSLGTSAHTSAASSITSSTGTATSTSMTATEFANPLIAPVSQTQPAVSGTLNGMAWVKDRNGITNHILVDTIRGNNKLSSNLTDAQAGGWTWSPGADGFGIQFNNVAWSGTTRNYAAWQFREYPKFFDIVTYTGDGVAGRTISHNLGSVPGCIIIKRTDDTGNNWAVYHRSVGNTGALALDLQDAAVTSSGYWNNTNPTSTTFTVGNFNVVNRSAATYVAYLFAHDAGGFGLTGTDNVISCGSFTTDGTGNATVNLGYEPQWLLTKCSGTVQEWFLVDSMRGFIVNNNPGGGAPYSTYLSPNNQNDDALVGIAIQPTGFNVNLQVNQPYIYVAVRRGPMKVPTSSSSVYFGFAREGTSSATDLPTATFTPDMALQKRYDAGGANGVIGSRLTTSRTLLPDNPAGEQTGRITNFLFESVRVGFNGDNNASPYNYINYFMGRVPGFLDVVCYTGTGANRTVTHNLGVVPEFMWVKRRNASDDWAVYNTTTGNNAALALNSSGTASTSSTFWNTTTPTASVFTVGTDSRVNASGSNYIAYLFASCPGVSKIGSYTGTGSATAVQINCGFTNGARFVLTKRIDGAGSNWFVWDSVRGLTSTTAPRIRLDTTDAEVASTWMRAYSAGFEITTAAGDLNASGGSYIFLAIA
jgi:hypothetical protein